MFKGGVTCSDALGLGACASKYMAKYGKTAKLETINKDRGNDNFINLFNLRFYVNGNLNRFRKHNKISLKPSSILILT